MEGIPSAGNANGMAAVGLCSDQAVRRSGALRREGSVSRESDGRVRVDGEDTARGQREDDAVLRVRSAAVQVKCAARGGVAAVLDVAIRTVGVGVFSGGCAKGSARPATSSAADRKSVV